MRTHPDSDPHGIHRRPSAPVVERRRGANARAVATRAAASLRHSKGAGPGFLAAVAITLGLVVAVLVFVPFVALSFRRRGGFGAGRFLLWGGALVAVMAIWTYTLLPLPDPDAIRCAGVNVDVTALADDVRAADRPPRRRRGHGSRRRAAAAERAAVRAARVLHPRARRPGRRHGPRRRPRAVGDHRTHAVHRASGASTRARTACSTSAICS